MASDVRNALGGMWEGGNSLQKIAEISVTKRRRVEVSALRRGDATNKVARARAGGLAFFSSLFSASESILQLLTPGHINVFFLE